MEKGWKQYANVIWLNQSDLFSAPYNCIQIPLETPKGLEIEMSLSDACWILLVRSAKQSKTCKADQTSASVNSVGFSRLTFNGMQPLEEQQNGQQQQQRSLC